MNVYADSRDTLAAWGSVMRDFGVTRSSMARDRRVELALCLQTQLIVNGLWNEEAAVLKRLSIPILVRLFRSPAGGFLRGLADASECSEVFRLGAYDPHMLPTDGMWVADVVRRVREVVTANTLYFGGIAAANGRLYLVASE